mgnify:CR=1 FL=1
MDAIKSYLENMFLHLPKSPEVMRAKDELSQMMEDKYNQLRSEGRTDNEAVGQVIAEFGNLDELAANLGISNEVNALDTGEPAQNRLYLRSGRMLAPFADDEVLVSESFALAHKLQPGDRLRATVYGRTQWFTIVGMAVSPEYVYQIKPGAMFPDYQRYAILWMNRRALEAACGHPLTDGDLIATLCDGQLAGAGSHVGDAAAASGPMYQIAITRCPDCMRAWQDVAGHTIEISETELAQASCDAELLGRVDGDKPARATKTIPPRTRRAVLRRDRGRCRSIVC